MPDVRTIDEVIEQLDRIIATATAEGSRLGLFAAMYRQVTLRVKQGIAAGFFDDGPRMERLDVRFASRYFDALATWQAGGAPSRCWKLALEASHRTDLVILQHLLLGMNAHINFDLAIAAATLFPDGALPALRADFDRINQVLAGMISEVSRVLDRFSPMLKLIDRFDNAIEDAVVNFSIRAARDDAWQHAALLAVAPPDQRPVTLQIIDAKTTFLGRLIAEPGRMLTALLDAVYLQESDDIAAVIQALNAITAG
jgi:hypothetical protein